MRLSLFAQAPFWVAILAVGEALSQALDTMTAHTPGHCCAGSERTYDQTDVIVA